jgi:hypothetical protein
VAAMAHLMGVKKEPSVGTMRLSRLFRGSFLCSVIHRSTFCMTCGTGAVNCGQRHGGGRWRGGQRRGGRRRGRTSRLVCVLCI